jgi:quercetin dioxygenase-like cupin family protein
MLVLLIRRVAMKKLLLPIAIAACALATQLAPAAPPPDVKEMMSKPLPDIPGKEGLMLTVTYPPGGADEIHRHDAHAFVYVLEGSIVMQLQGAKPVTLKAGETFYEGPNDVHIVGRPWQFMKVKLCLLAFQKLHRGATPYMKVRGPQIISEVSTFTIPWEVNLQRRRKYVTT